MSFCSKCGKEIEGTDKYCTFCNQGVKGGKRLKLKYVGMLVAIILAFIYMISAEYTAVGALLVAAPFGLIGFAIGAVIDQFRN